MYGSVVAGRYSNQHVLPLAHMKVRHSLCNLLMMSGGICYLCLQVSGDPSYQPEINTTFTIDSLDEQLGMAYGTSCPL